MSREIQKAYSEVERVLYCYPKECSINYYENKKTLKVEYEKASKMPDGAIAAYEANSNTVFVNNKYGVEVVYHELFHMAFNNKYNTLNQLNSFNKDKLKYNGVSIVSVGQPSKIEFNAINEAFAQYLASKCDGAHETYTEITLLTDILVAIHGEDILCYPLLNDHEGFINDKRFYDIRAYAHNLDLFKDELEDFKRMEESKVFLENEDMRDRLKEIRIPRIRKYFLNLLNNLYYEYINSKTKRITPDEFIGYIDRLTLSSMCKFFKTDEYGTSFTDYGIVNLYSLIEMEKSNKRVRKK